jgi:hypothetical protein
MFPPGDAPKPIDPSTPSENQHALLETGGATAAAAVHADLVERLEREQQHRIALQRQMQEWAGWAACPYQWPDTQNNPKFDWPWLVWEGGCFMQKSSFEVGLRWFWVDWLVFPFLV